eukprot:scaffold650638_cov45-Prasinocladus_malaysianus.AAC.1
MAELRPAGNRPIRSQTPIAHMYESHNAEFGSRNEMITPSFQLLSGGNSQTYTFQRAIQQH